MSPNALSMLIGNRLKALGMNQVEFAALVGAEQATVSRWLAGRVIPKPAMVPLIASALKIDEREVWTTRSTAQEERLKRSAQDTKTARRETHDVIAKVEMFVATYESFHAAYEQIGERVDQLVEEVGTIGKVVEEIRRVLDQPPRRPGRT